MNMSFIRSYGFSLFHTFRGYKKKNFISDLISGLIIGAVSIPISMGYAQIAGLPPVYGLYGSVFPVLIFALFSTSPQFIFGVDAAPAALVGSSLLSLGITPYSQQALAVVPLITFWTSCFLLLFSVFKFGKLVRYISSPVMGGFITGICVEIIMMQIPKLLGGTAGTGEAWELLYHIFQTILNINWPSFIMGAGTLVILLVCKRFIPKIPVGVIMMILGATLSFVLPYNQWGILCLSKVDGGLPKFIALDFSALPVLEGLKISLPIALVIMAETLLAENNLASKNGYKLNDNQEILSFGLGNLIGAFTGCCPINGSVSRSAMGEQYGAKTQVTQIVSSVAMIMVLLLLAPFIQYLPVPVLTAIVISALIGACEFHLAKKLWKVSRKEFFIFCFAFAGVLVFGTIYGVLIGVALSFISVIIRTSNPPRGFLGISPGHEEFFNMDTFKYVYPVKGVVVYRFSANLFFANIGLFQNDIEQAIKPDTKIVVIDCSAIGSIDVTAAERLEIIYKNMKARNIRFYLAEHIASLNDQFRALGIGYMIEEGAVRRTINVALKDAGIKKPYELDGAENKVHSIIRKRADNAVKEFVWAFGDEAEIQIEKQIHNKIEEFKVSHNFAVLSHSNWNSMSGLDEDEWIEHLESHLVEIAKASQSDENEIARRLEKRRQEIIQHINDRHPDLQEKFMASRTRLDEKLKKDHPEIYKKIMELRNIN